jgi:hypothetical protein
MGDEWMKETHSMERFDIVSFCMFGFDVMELPLEFYLYVWSFETCTVYRTRRSRTAWSLRIILALVCMQWSLNHHPSGWISRVVLYLCFVFCPQHDADRFLTKPKKHKDEIMLFSFRRNDGVSWNNH